MDIEIELRTDPMKWKRATIAKLISKAEEGPSKARHIVNSILSFTGNAHIIGIIGPPGCGKSTLIEKLALQMRRTKNGKIGIIAVDPSSPYSGGAFMGNRIRMRQASQDTGIFIRSMSTRGSQSGLSASTSVAVKILDAAGMDPIIIETVGAGQVQTDIVKAAYTVVIVLQPESGDIIQAMKAGLMEIGDIFVINKSDLRGTTKAVNNFSAILPQSHTDAWLPRIVRTVATKNKGIAELAKDIEEHRSYPTSSGKLLKKREEVARNDIKQIVEEVRRVVDERLNESKQAFQNIIYDIVTKKSVLMTQQIN